ncbi:MAG: hypothetical protein AAF253_08000, partial [Pseudomonadota bacterium]
MTFDHPSDAPDAAPLWAELFALIGMLARLLGPAGDGSIGVPIGLRKQICTALREAEGKLRRLLLQPAEALIPWLPPLRARPGEPARLARSTPDAPTHPADWRRFRLHETVSSDPGTPVTQAPDLTLRDTPCDRFGTARVSVSAEFQRFACLVATASAPARAIGRLARILRRRGARMGKAVPPWSARWPAHW